MANVDGSGHSADTSTPHAAVAGNVPWQESGFDGNDDVVKNVMDPSAGKDNVCRNCNQEGHFSRDCPEAGKGGGGCFNCGAEGHSKAECPKERVFTGTCRICDKEGHFAAACPEKVPDKCRNCGQEGHKIAECTAKRALVFDKVADKTDEEVWKDLVQADNERDLDDLREGVQILQKANRGLTYAELEAEFRKRAMNTFVIAYEQELSGTFTLMDLDGSTARKYNIGYFFSATAPRVSLAPGWPASAEDNIERLKDAGLPVDTKIPKCSNCDEMGHIAKSCKEEKRVRDKLEVKCVVCKETGHRARDCTEERVDRFACRTCKKLGHNSKDCPDREIETCRNCGEEGHRAKECEKPRVEKCRNCDEEGHHSRDCPKPRDWSRVQCSNCSQMGHGRGRCKEPLKEEGQDENSKPDVKPTTASAIDTGGQDSDFERKPVVVVGDPSW